MPHLEVKLADGRTEKILLPANANPDSELLAFLSRSGSYANGPWIALASGLHARYDQIVTVRLTS